jgi:branched-chain amino acid transport system ATP-binding protein
MNEHGIEVRSLTAGYGDVAVLRDVSVAVGAGEIVALLGPNGAGKTSLLATIAGLVSPMVGTVRLGGADVVAVPTHRRIRAGLAMVPDDRALIGSLTVAESLALVRPWRVHPYETFPELEPLAGRRAGLLSGGEQQMLAMARALAARPRFLLVDELSLGLAPLVVQRLLDVLTRISTDWGTAVLIVEQHVAQILTVATRAVVLVNGRIELENDAATLSKRPHLLEQAYLGAG